jgi:hypothetical protein
MIGRILLAILVLATLVLHVRGREQQKNLFRPERSIANLRSLLHGHKPTVGSWEEKQIDDAMAQWKLEGPVTVALPPMYSRTAFGNAGFLTSFLNHGEALLYNGPFPHPKLDIHERFSGHSDVDAYTFDNRSTNASLFVALGRHTWPLGYTAWYDLVFLRRPVWRTTPTLVDAGGYRIKPTAVYTVNPLNHAEMNAESTYVEMGHLSPVVWIFPREGRLEDVDDDGQGYVVDSVLDGAEVSWMPSLPVSVERPLGMFLLSPVLRKEATHAPPWWQIDEELRRAIVDEKPVAERRQLVQRLAQAFPRHPFLPHYRVVAELGGDRFDEAWLMSQQMSCDLPTWYLVAWTKLSWRDVRELPCLADLPAGPLKEDGQYIAESVVLAFRALRDNQELKALAARDIDTTYLRTEFRGFNYPPSNFAWLWLEARP